MHTEQPTSAANGRAKNTLFLFIWNSFFGTKYNFTRAIFHWMDFFVAAAAGSLRFFPLSCILFGRESERIASPRRMNASVCLAAARLEWAERQREKPLARCRCWLGAFFRLESIDTIESHNEHSISMPTFLLLCVFRSPFIGHSNFVAEPNWMKILWVCRPLQLLRHQLSAGEMRSRCGSGSTACAHNSHN